MASLSLAFDILANDQGASKTFRAVGEASEDAGKKGEGFGRSMKAGIAVAAGALAAAGIGTMLKGFIEEAQESAKIGRLTAAVIESTGGVANVTAKQVDELATALSNKSAVDDELIANAANVLLTFTKVRNEVGEGNDIFDQATEAALNMSAALGTDLQGASMLVGKALNDPIKGMTALTRSGITFTAQQKEQVAAMVAAGDTLGAQTIILAELETQFGGAAEAAADPIERLQVILGNLGEQIGGYLLPIVEKVATFFGETLAPAAGQVFDVLFRGDFTGGPFEEDHPFMVNLFKVRDWFLTAKDYAVQMFDVLFRGDFTGGPLEEDSTFVSRLFDIRDTFIAIKDGAQQAFDVLFRGDFTGGPLEEDSGFVTTLFGVRDTIGEIGTKAGELATWFREDALPVLQQVWDFLVVNFTPTWEALVDVYNEQLAPALADMKVAFEDNWPAIQQVLKVLGLLIGAFLLGYTAIAGKVLPVLIELAGFFIGYYSTALGVARDAAGWLVDKFGDLHEWVGSALDRFSAFTDALRDFELPAWVDTLLEKISGVAGFLGNAATGVGNFLGGIGDAPASLTGVHIGGPALARVQAALPAGLRISSTYRSPAQNAAVGGHPQSLHMDRNNPAVDIAGPTGLLDSFARTLAGMGNWRQLLWRVAGHYDHIHVAHNGGMVSSSWPTVPGLRSDERPVIAQVGEEIIPVGGKKGGGGVNMDFRGASFGFSADEVATKIRNKTVDALSVYGVLA